MTKQAIPKHHFYLGIAAATACLVALAIAGSIITSSGATSYLWLEFTPSAQTMREIVASWSTHNVGHIGAFAMWFDYLFMAAYATLFVFSARICLAASWTIPARLRSGLVALPSVAIVTALLDAVENGFEMLIGYGLAPVPDVLAPTALAVTIVKWIGVVLCLPATTAAIWAIATRRY